MTSVSAPSALRSCETKFWSEVPAVRGGDSPHSASISESVETTRPALQHEQREHRPLLLPGRRDRPVLAFHFERAEDPECGHVPVVTPVGNGSQRRFPASVGRAFPDLGGAGDGPLAGRWRRLRAPLAAGPTLRPCQRTPPISGSTAQAPPRSSWRSSPLLTALAATRPGAAPDRAAPNGAPSSDDTRRLRVRLARQAVPPPAPRARALRRPADRPGDDGTIVRQFHFGIDVSAPNGTPVYATQSGTVSLLHPDVVAIVSGSTEFSYWHLIPTVRSGMHAVAYRTVIGRIQKPWAHVHFSERVGGVYLNPLRPGALGPYADGTRPTVDAIRVARDGSGRLDLVAEVFDDTPLRGRRAVDGQAGHARARPLAPARPEVAAPGWRTAIDFRRTIPSASSFFAFYADGTRQNHASVQGRYRVYLARDLDLRALPSGRYAVEVVAADGHGNSAHSVARFTVRNGSAAL